MTQIAGLAAFWGPQARPPELIARRENAVYALHLADGRRAALRLHRPGYRSRAEVLSELAWTEALAAAGFPCPRPIRAPNGALIAEAGPLASAVTWMDGAAPEPQHAALPAQAHALGALLRRLHDSADALTLPPPPGPGWTLDTLLGDAPRLGRFWDSPALSPVGRDVLIQARDALRAALPALPGSGIGFVHADPLRENLLLASGRLALIDFDDCGIGLRGYDLGSALIQTCDTPGAAERAAALAEGYGLPSLAAALPGWTVLRGLASCGWAVSRLPPGDRRIAAYAQRAERLSRAWLG